MEIAEGVVQLRLPLPYRPPPPSTAICSRGATAARSSTRGRASRRDRRHSSWRSARPGWSPARFARSFSPTCTRTMPAARLRWWSAAAASSCVSRPRHRQRRLPRRAAPLEERHAVCLREEASRPASCPTGLRPTSPTTGTIRASSPTGCWRMGRCSTAWRGPGRSSPPRSLAHPDRALRGAPAVAAVGRPRVRARHPVPRVRPQPRPARGAPRVARPGRAPPPRAAPARARAARRGTAACLARARNATLAACARVRGELSAQPRSAYEIALARLGGERKRTAAKRGSRSRRRSSATSSSTGTWWRRRATTKCGACGCRSRAHEGVGLGRNRWCGRPRGCRGAGRSSLRFGGPGGAAGPGLQASSAAGTRRPAGPRRRGAARRSHAGAGRARPDGSARSAPSSATRRSRALSSAVQTRQFRSPSTATRAAANVP